MQRDNLRYGLLQLSYGDWLHEVPVEARFNRTCLVYLPSAQRGEKKFSSFRELANTSGGLVPIHARHADIQQDQMWLEFSEKLQCLFAAVDRPGPLRQGISEA